MAETLASSNATLEGSITTLLGSFQTGGLKKKANALLREAKVVSREYKKEIEQRLIEINIILVGAQSGKYDKIGVQRAIARRRRAINRLVGGAEIEGLKLAAKAYLSTVGDIVSLVSLFFSFV